MEILELKNTITKIKYSLKELNKIFDVAEETISKLKDRLVESMYSEEQREKEIKKIHRVSEKYEMSLSTPVYM